MTRKKFDLSLLPDAPNLQFERELWRSGVCHIAGIDEAGRGALAGPVAAGAVILPDRPDLPDILCGVQDSKLMTANARQRWAEVIRQTALACQVGFASAEEIDALGIVPATRLAATRALENLSSAPQYLLLDFLSLPALDVPQTSLIKGDRRSLSIAAASILAKVERDALMIELDSKYPGYGFARHKGYGTAAHRDAIEATGPCPIHRMSFAPMREDDLLRLL